MSREFKDRLARGELTNTRDHRRMKEALRDAKEEESAKGTVDVKGSDDSQEWKNWDLSPVWSASDAAGESANGKNRGSASDIIQADSVQRALDIVDKNL